MSTWVGQYAPLKLFRMWTKVHQVSFVQPGRDCSLVDQVVFRFLMCPHVPEIFAIKVESCQKTCRNLVVFWPFKYLGGGPFKSRTHIITPASRHVVWKKFRKDIPTGPEVIGAQTLNFMPNFKFSPLNFFGGTPVPDRGALDSLGQSLARVKI